MKEKFIDDNISYIEDDVEKIQTKPGMYISYLGEKGALHLVKEAVNNAIDECVNPKSPGNHVLIQYDDDNNAVYVTDNGRGLPIDKAEIVCTKIQSGSKFSRDEEVIDVFKKTFSAGENGVGNTAITALSELLELDIHWQGQHGQFKFIDGKLVDKKITEDNSKSVSGKLLHGTTFKFVPSRKYLGKCKLKFKDIEKWVRNTSYLIDPKIRLTLQKIENGKVTKEYQYHHDIGMVELLQDSVEKKMMINPIFISFEGYYLLDNDKVYIFDGHKIKSHKDIKGEPIKVYAAFGLSEGGISDNEEGCLSFCDYIHTVDNGVHVNAAKLAWSQVVSKLTQEAMTENELKKYPITYEDTRDSLVFTLNLFCDKPQFASQTKEKISNDELFKPIRQIIYTKLMEILKANPKDLKTITNWVKTCAKSRLEVTKIKKSDYKSMDSLSENTLSCFDPAYDPHYKELFIVEGGSAKGSLTLGRDARTQAIFAVKGVPLNVFDCKLSEVMKNDEFRYLIKILGCGVGKDFDITKLKYDKIIIFTDSDIDGFRIASLLSVFFMTQMPEIVKAGKLYKAVAPLYIIDDKKHPYLLSKHEYAELHASNLSNKITIETLKGEKLSKKEIHNLIINNYEYLSELKYLVRYFYTHPDIIEFIVRYYESKDFAKKLKKRFKELEFTNGVVHGVYNYTTQYITLDETFFHRTRNLYKMIFDVNDGNIYYNFIDDTRYNDVSIGSILQHCEKYLPKILSRIKGLGELPPEVLWETTLNPAKRELLQLNIDKMEVDMAKFKILHAENNAEERRKLMADYVLNKDDIDN